jgi:hypothetical protein
MKYTQDELLAAIHHANHNDLVGMMTMVLKMRLSADARDRLAYIIMGDKKQEAHYVNLALDRSIPLIALKELAVSPIMQYVQPLIEAAMHEDGPFQSREVMLLAASIAGHKPYYMGKEIARKDKTLVGYILTMAGLERRSHFDKDRKSPIKAWKPRRGVTKLTVKQRADMVYSIMSEYLKPHTALTLENLI